MPKVNHSRVLSKQGVDISVKGYMKMELPIQHIYILMISVGPDFLTKDVDI